MKKAGLIYAATMPDGREYVGLTTRSLELRIKEHVHNAYIDEKSEGIGAAIRAHGADNVRWRVLEDGIKGRRRLGDRERYWIKKLGTLSPLGLNLAVGGSVGGGNGSIVDVFMPPPNTVEREIVVLRLRAMGYDGALLTTEEGLEKITGKARLVLTKIRDNWTPREAQLVGCFGESVERNWRDDNGKKKYWSFGAWYPDRDR